jgi:hypothetical protein
VQVFRRIKLARGDQAIYRTSYLEAGEIEEFAEEQGVELESSG